MASAASSTSPAATCARIRVDDQASPSPASPTASTSKPHRRAELGAAGGRPRRPGARTGSSPRPRRRGRAACRRARARRTPRGDRRDSSTVNGSTRTAAAPASPSSRTRCSRVLRRGGCVPGRTTSDGCGSNVTTTTGTSRRVGRLAGGVEDRAVAAVHPVEDADRDGRAGEARGHRRGAVPAIDHAGILPERHPHTTRCAITSPRRSARDSRSPSGPRTPTGPGPGRPGGQGSRVPWRTRAASSALTVTVGNDARHRRHRGHDARVRLDRGKRAGRVDAERPDPGPAQRHQVAAHPEVRAEVAGKRAHVGAGGADDVQWDVDDRGPVLQARAP